MAGVRCCDDGAVIGQLWAGLVKQVGQGAQSTAVKTALKNSGEAIVTSVAGVVTTGGTAALRQRVAKRKNRPLAEQLALQIPDGTVSWSIIERDWYWVVWQQETAFEAFPALPEELGPLAERRELKNYQGPRYKPSADSS